MTLPIWPTAELPRPKRDGYARTYPDGRQSTKNDAGPPRGRLRFSAAPAFISLQFDMTHAQRARFMTFWTTDTVNGSKPFVVPDWTEISIPLLAADGTPLTTDAGTLLATDAWLLAMFSYDKPPSETIVGNGFRIAVQLTILP